MSIQSPLYGQRPRYAQRQMKPIICSKPQVSLGKCTLGRCNPGMCNQGRCNPGKSKCTVFNVLFKCSVPNVLLDILLNSTLNRNSTFISRLTKFLKVQNKNEFKSLISYFIELKKQL